MGKGKESKATGAPSIKKLKVTTVGKAAAPKRAVSARTPQPKATPGRSAKSRTSQANQFHMAARSSNRTSMRSMSTAMPNSHGNSHRTSLRTSRTSNDLGNPDLDDLVDLGNNLRFRNMATAG